jgi:hypothetical protein
LADSRSSTCPHARRCWSGLPRSPSPAAVRKGYGSSCPTRPCDRRRPATLKQDLPWPQSDHAGLRIDLNWGRGAVTLGSGVGRSSVLMPDRIPATTDRPVERQPGPSRQVCPAHRHVRMRAGADRRRNDAGVDAARTSCHACDERAHRLQVPARSSGNLPRRRSLTPLEWPHPDLAIAGLRPISGELERDIEGGGRDDPEDAACFSSPADLCHMLQVVAVSYCGRPVVR